MCTFHPITQTTKQYSSVAREFGPVVDCEKVSYLLLRDKRHVHRQNEEDISTDLWVGEYYLNAMLFVCFAGESVASYAPIWRKQQVVELQL